MPTQYEYKLAVTRVGIWLYAPLVSVNTNQIHHYYTCYNYNMGADVKTINYLYTTNSLDWLNKVNVCMLV